MTAVRRNHINNVGDSHTSAYINALSMLCSLHYNMNKVTNNYDSKTQSLASCYHYLTYQTDDKLGASGHWLRTRTGAGGTTTLE